MNQSRYAEIFAALGQRGGMEDGRYLIGRDDVLMRLINCTRGEKRDPAWIFGPRRIGKSSVARQLARMASESGALVIWVDASAMTSLEDVLIRVEERFPTKFDSKLHIYQRVEELAKSSSDRPILIILDEFDGVAVSLETTEQGLLRRLSEENRFFTYIFVTRLRPGLVIHEVPDANSRLLGICNAAEIPPLRESDIVDLAVRVFDQAAVVYDDEIPRWIWRHVGGGPIAVMTLLREFLLAAVNEYEDEVEDIALQAKNEVSAFLLSYWWDLRQITRRFLIDDHDLNWAEAEDVISELQYDGIVHRRKKINKPLWLVDVGKKAGLIRDVQCYQGIYQENHVARMHDLIASINEAGSLGFGCAPFKVSSEVLKYHYLTRNNCDEDNFKSAIDHMHKIFYKGASHATFSDGGLNRNWNFPVEEIANTYSKSQVIMDIEQLWCFFHSDQPKDTDSEEISDKFKEAGDIFMAYCNARILRSNKQRRLVLDSILAKVLELLENVHLALQEGGTS